MIHMSCPFAPNFSIYSHQMQFSNHSYALHVWDFGTCLANHGKFTQHHGLLGYVLPTSAPLGLKDLQRHESNEVSWDQSACKFHFFASNSSPHCFCEQPSALKAPATQRSWTLMIPTSTFKQWLLRQRCRRWISLWIPSCLVSAPIFMSNKTMAFLQMSCETKTLKKVCCWKTTFLLGQYIFRGYVKLQVGKYAISLLEMLRLLTWQN